VLQCCEHVPIPETTMATAVPFYRRIWPYVCLLFAMVALSFVGRAWTNARSEERILDAVARRGGIGYELGWPEGVESWLYRRGWKRNCERAFGTIVSIEATVVIDAKAVKEVAAVCPHLKTLMLQASTDVDDAMLSQLGPYDELEWLMMYDTQVTDAGLKNLGPMPQLGALHLSGMPIDGSMLQQIDPAAPLVGVCLARTNITDEDLVQLSRFPIEHLNLSSTDISEAGIESLTKLPRLEKLILDNIPLSDECVDELSSIVQLSSFKTLRIRGTRISNDGFAQIIASNASVEVIHQFPPDWDDSPESDDK